MFLRNFLAGPPAIAKVLTVRCQAVYFRMVFFIFIFPIVLPPPTDIARARLCLCVCSDNKTKNKWNQTKRKSQIRGRPPLCSVGMTSRRVVVVKAVTFRTITLPHPVLGLFYTIRFFDSKRIKTKNRHYAFTLSIFLSRGIGKRIKTRRSHVVINHVINAMKT